MSRPLTPKERRFVSEFIVDQNGTKAAIRAGFSKRTARQLASRLLSKGHIHSAISFELKKIEDKSELTAARIHKAVLAVLEFDPRDAFNENGTLKDISDIPDKVALAIAGIDVDEIYAPGTGRAKIGETKKLRFSDRMRAAELGAKLLGLLRLEITGKGGLPLIPAPPIDFSGITTDELRKAIELYGSNGHSGQLSG